MFKAYPIYLNDSKWYLVLVRSESYTFVTRRISNCSLLYNFWRLTDILYKQLFNILSTKNCIIQSRVYISSFTKHLAIWCCLLHLVHIHYMVMNIDLINYPLPNVSDSARGKNVKFVVFVVLLFFSLAVCPCRCLVGFLSSLSFL